MVRGLGRLPSLSPGRRPSAPDNNRYPPTEAPSLASLALKQQGNICIVYVKDMLGNLGIVEWGEGELFTLRQRQLLKVHDWPRGQSWRWWFAQVRSALLGEGVMTDGRRAVCTGRARRAGSVKGRSARDRCRRFRSVVSLRCLALQLFQRLFRLVTAGKCRSRFQGLIEIGACRIARP